MILQYQAWVKCGLHCVTGQCAQRPIIQQGDVHTSTQMLHGIGLKKHGL